MKNCPSFFLKIRINKISSSKWKSDNNIALSYPFCTTGVQYSCLELRKLDKALFPDSAILHEPLSLVV